MSALVLLEIYQPPKSAVDQVLDFMEGFLGPFVPLVLLLLASVALLGLGMAVRPAGRPKGGKRRMPPGWVQYKTTSVFTQDTVPAGLLKRHSTKRGAWGKVRVLEGQMRLRYLDSVAHDQSEAGECLGTGDSDGASRRHVCTVPTGLLPPPH